ncbi:MAG: META domain-containing protein [Actinomycetota bacterium]|nr:META domain-containing protein [Actinomycetota bacterium]
MKKLLLTLGMIGVLVTSCGDPAEPASIEGVWQLESGLLDTEPIPMVDGFPITLTIDAATVGGTAACNGYGGSYTLDGGKLVFSEMGATAMACSPEEAMTSERVFLEALVRATTVTATDDHLTLAGEGVELEFNELPPVPTADLTNTVWVLVSLIDGDTASSVGGERATLELFTDGSMLGSTGCRSLHGRYVVSGGEVQMNELAAEGECPQQLEAQDSQVVAVLGDGFRALVDGDHLTLTSTGNQGLVYRAEG